MSLPVTNRIIALAPGWERPSGGVRKIYRHVDVLNGVGYNACVGHREAGFRCTWFENQTVVKHPPEIWPPRPNDILIIPEVMAWELQRLARGVRKVIFNQNPYQTFMGQTPADAIAPYRSQDVLASIVVSEESKAYLQYAFPNHQVHRIRNSIDRTHFYCPTGKKRLIAYMERKKPTDIRQLGLLLQAHGALGDFQVVNIQNKTEAETAAILRDSAIFLSFASQEGMALPPLEAMACGCAVVGYDGVGCREYFVEPNATPVPQEDVLAFAQGVERAIHRIQADPDGFFRERQQVSAWVLNHYSPANEETSIIRAWQAILSGASANQTSDPAPPTVR